jgi:NADH pyrophosphatase NudC (nudix superfamily)
MIKSGWYHCPYCGKKIQKVEPDSVLYGTPLFCKKCGITTYPTIYKGRELEDDEPFPFPA